MLGSHNVVCSCDKRAYQPFRLETSFSPKGCTNHLVSYVVYSHDVFITLLTTFFKD